MFSFQGRRPSWSAGEWEARRAAAQAARGDVVPELEAVPEETGPLPAHARKALGSAGQPLDERTRADFETRFGHDFGRVRVHADAGAARSAAELRARAYTVGEDIVFGSGRYEPGTTAGRSLIAHELAHVVQQGRAGRPALQPDSELESLPENERKQIQVLTDSLPRQVREDIERIYQAPGAPKLPAGMTVQLGASIDTSSQDGLKAVVGVLVSGEEDVALPPNRSITLAIAAAGQVYRFTRVRRASKAEELVLVERTGDLGAVQEQERTTRPAWEAFPEPYTKDHGPLTHRQARQMSDCLALGAGLDACQEVVPEAKLGKWSFKVRGATFKRGAGWKVSEWLVLSAALETLPETVLRQAAGITFLRAPEKIVNGNKADADTSFAAGTITFFNIAFRESTTRHGTDTPLKATLIHEIGHLADADPLVEPMSAYLASKTPEDKQKVVDARARSGMAWADDVFAPDGIRIKLKDPGDVLSAFRAAAVLDGLVWKDGKIKGGGITAYSHVGWGEMFTECYMLYFTDPDLLKAIRPHIYQYFEAIWPQKKKK